MPVAEEITPLRLEGELNKCPNCGYEYGFHSSFLDANASCGPIKVRTTTRVFRVILICPECGARYDVGWRIQPVEMAVKVKEIEHAPAVTNALPEPVNKLDEI